MAETKLESTRASLERIQGFDVAGLAGVDRLGSGLNFLDATKPAARIVGLFQQIPAQFLEELPANYLDNIKSYADSVFNIFESILAFDPRQSDAYSQNQQLTEKIKSYYDSSFESLLPVITYSASRLRDFAALEREARAAVQSAKDYANELTSQLESQNANAQRILDDVRKVAAEQGVSQQARYFKDESDAHSAAAEKWQKYTVIISLVLAAYAAISIFLHKIPVLSPENSYDAIQLSISKILLFVVVAYLLILSARNFLSHKHNEIVNRHRQNALLTFSALADAAASEERRDVVLTYAASCIFAPQETGYAKSASQAEPPINVIQALPKLTSSGT